MFAPLRRVGAKRNSGVFVRYARKHAAINLRCCRAYTCNKCSSVPLRRPGANAFIFNKGSVSDISLSYFALSNVLKNRITAGKSGHSFSAGAGGSFIHNFTVLFFANCGILYRLSRSGTCARIQQEGI